MPKFSDFINELTLFTYRDAIDAVRKDSGLDICLDPVDYLVEDNYFTYFILINTWLFQVEEVSTAARYDLAHEIKTVGLITVIRECEKTADAIISNDECYVHWLSSLVQECKRRYEAPTWVKVCLQLLRYPKRLSPAGCSALEKASLEKFLSVNKRCKLIDRTESPYYITRDMRVILGGLRPKHTSMGEFSNGSCCDSSKAVIDKVLSAVSAFPYQMGWNIPITRESESVSEIQAVPKSYKARRIIAKERAGAQWLYQSLRKDLLLSMESRVPGTVYKYSDFITLYDQVRSQDGCAFGSLTGSLATLDLSNASDTIRYSIAREVFPNWVIDRIDPIRSQALVVGTKKVTPYLFLTAGTAATFPCESLFFLAVAISSIRYFNAVAGERIPITPKNVYVYGDDIIIPTQCASICMEFLSKIGCIVNEEKSFYSPLSEWTYREACGAELLNGEDVSTQYFSRKTLSPCDAVSIKRLTELQHKLYANWRAARWLESVVLWLKPDMTFSLAGAECDDLWTDSPSRILYRKLKKFKLRYTMSKINSDYTWSIVDWETSNPVKQTEVALIGDSDYETEVHYYCTSVASGRATVDDTVVTRCAYEEYLYQYFLMTGPRYDSALDRLLGVSTPLPSFRELSRETRSVWKKF